MDLLTNEYSVDLAEFHAQHRCLACQEDDRKCIIGQTWSKCMLCEEMKEECNFQRTIQVQGSKDEFNWSALIDPTHVLAVRNAAMAMNVYMTSFPFQISLQ